MRKTLGFNGVTCRTHNVVMLPVGLNVIDQPPLSDWLNTN